MMVNEEEYLKRKMGQRMPFRVPEGYFDLLAERVMQQIPEEPAQPEAEQLTGTERPKLTGTARKPATVRHLRPWLYAAACTGVVALSATLFFKSAPTAADGQQYAMTTQAGEAQDASTADYSDTYVEDAANYAMIDNEEIYAYLADL